MVKEAPPKPRKMFPETLPYNYDATGALTPEQRDERLEGLSRVLLDIFLSLSPEQKARYLSTK
jgi:hypothetical protein